MNKRSLALSGIWSEVIRVRNVAFAVFCGLLLAAQNASAQTLPTDVEDYAVDWAAIGAGLGTLLVGGIVVISLFSMGVMLVSQLFTYFSKGVRRGAR